MRVLRIVLFVAAAGIALAIILSLLHLVIAAAVVVAAAIFVMAVWKAMFGPSRKVLSTGPVEQERLNS